MSKKKLWSIISAISVIVGLLGFFGIQPYWTKPEINIDSEALAKQLVKHLPDQQDFAAKEEEIRQLKNTIERLKKDPADELKQAALQALAEDDTKKAVELMEQSAQFSTEKAEELTWEAAWDWIDIGSIAYLNDSQKALSAYKKATNLDPSNPVAWNGLGRIQFRLGNLDESRQAFEKTLELAGNDKQHQSGAYSNLGVIYKTYGQLDKAEDYHLKALEIDKNLGCKEGIAADYSNLGVICQIRGKLDKAEDYHLKSFDINKTLGRKEGMAFDYGSLGTVYHIRGELDKAEEYCVKALDINKDLSSMEGMASNYGNLGIIYQKRGNLNKAEEYYLKSLDINKKLDIKEGMAIQYRHLGIIYQTRGDLDKACELWQQSLKLFTDVGVQGEIDIVSGWISQFCKEKE